MSDEIAPKQPLPLPMLGRERDTDLKDILNGLKRNPARLKQLTREERDEVMSQFGPATIENIVFPTNGLTRFNAPIIVSPAAPPIICFQRSRTVPAIALPTLLGWGSPFGSSVRMLFKFKRAYGQAVFPVNSPEFDPLSKGLVYVAIYIREKITQIFSIDYKHSYQTATHWNQLMQSALVNHEQILQSPFSYDNPQLVRFYVITEKIFGDRFTPFDELQRGWLAAFHEIWGRGIELLQNLDLSTITEGDEELLAGIPFLEKHYDFIKNENNLSKIQEHLITLFNDKMRLEEWFDDVEVFSQRRKASGYVDGLDIFFETLQHTWGWLDLLNWNENNFGLRFPYHFESNEGKLALSSIKIDPIAMKAKNKNYPVKFWSRCTPHNIWHADRLIYPHDIQIEYNDEFAAAWSELRINRDPLELDNAANLLLEEAYATQKWTIPQRACISISFGPFVYAELTQVFNEVYFVWRNRRDEYMFCGINVLFKTTFIPTLSNQDEINMKVTAELKLLMAAIVRDFLVVEERQSVFATGRRRQMRRGRRQVGSPRVVYLPRRKYISDPRTTVTLFEGLNLAARAKHHVRAHARRVKPSLTQLKMAKEDRFDLPDGHTYVRAHYRGKAANDAIYRSRSALQLLYETVEQADYEAAPSHYPNWFKFERDMSVLLRKLGYTITKCSQPGYAGGVDIYATKKARGKNEDWLVQCKDWKETVGVSVAERLLGSLTDYDADNVSSITRGMIITTSQFSDDAIRYAAKHGIQLLDGEDIQAIVASVNRSSN